MSFEDVFDGVAEGAIASRVGSNVVRFFLHFGTGILHRDGESCHAHGREVDDIVSDESGFFRFESCLVQNFFERGAFVVDALADVFELEVASAQGDGLGDALGDETGPDAGETGERDRGAVVGMEAFGLDEGLALESESSLATVLRGLIFFCLSERTLLRAGWGREDEELAVGEDSVNVEEQEPDLAGAHLRGEFRHRAAF